MHKSIILLAIVSFATLFASCSPKIDPAPPAVQTVATLRLSPRVQSVSPGAALSFVATFTSADGGRSTIVPSLTSLQPSLVRVTTAGMAEALAGGTAMVIATHMGVSDTATINIVTDSTSLASIAISPDTFEINRGATATLPVLGRNLLGQEVSLSGTPSWTLTNPGLGSVNNGTFTGNNWGTTKVTARVGDISSNMAEVAVVRRGSFYGVENHYGSGSATVKVKNGQIIIRLEDDFLCQSAPDLRVYLSNAEVTRAVAQQGVEIALLRSLRGRQGYLVPASVDISQYAYLVIYCRAFSQGVLSTPLQ